MKKKATLVSILRYSELCGITVAAIYLRIKENKIQTIKKDGCSSQLIDLSQFPAKKEQKRGRKSFKEPISI